MPPYYFHRRMPDGDLQPDPIGRQFPTDAEALTAALRLIRELVEEQAGTIPTAIEVHDAAGWLVTTVPVEGR